MASTRPDPQLSFDFGDLAELPASVAVEQYVSIPAPISPSRTHPKRCPDCGHVHACTLTPQTSDCSDAPTSNGGQI
jgi:hypothetical protein